MTDQTATDLKKQRFLGEDRWWHIAFGTIMAVALVVFFVWARDYVPGPGFNLLLFTAIVLGLFMAFNIGGNDVANSFGTSVGAGTLTMKQALLVAAVFEVAGAVIAGGEVTETVRSGIVNLDVFAHEPMLFAFIMMASLIGAAVWLLIATKYGLPVSTTHSIIGAIVGASITVGITQGKGDVLAMVQWDQIGQIAISWVLSPLLGGIAAYLLFGFIKRHILLYNEKADRRLAKLKQDFIQQSGADEHDVDRIGLLQTAAYANARLPKQESNALAREAREALRIGDDPSAEAKYDHALRQLDKGVTEVQAHRALTVWVPLLGAAGAMIITLMLLFKGLKNLHIKFTNAQTALILLMVGTLVWFALLVFANTLKGKNLSRATFIIFSWMQVFTAAAFAFSHGSNDIANAIGPFAAVLDVLKTGGVSDKAVVPGIALFAFGAALIVGLWFIGRNVIKTVGSNLTKMHPSSGYAAELAAAIIVMLASQLGLPVSSTHILIGAVLGVGFVNQAANWRMMRPIGLAWVITLPVAALIGAVGVLLLQVIF